MHILSRVCLFKPHAVLFCSTKEKCTYTQKENFKNYDGSSIFHFMCNQMVILICAKVLVDILGQIIRQT